MTHRCDAAGVTIIEVLVAAFLLGLALVPLMQLYPAVLEADQEVEATMRMGAAAVRRTEELIGSLRNVMTSPIVGSGACPDFTGCFQEWTVATEASNPTQGVGSLATVVVITCVDADGSATCGASEVQVRYDTKVTSRP